MNKNHKEIYLFSKKNAKWNTNRNQWDEPFSPSSSSISSTIMINDNTRSSSSNEMVKHDYSPQTLRKEPKQRSVPSLEFTTDEDDNNHVIMVFYTK